MPKLEQINSTRILSSQNFSLTKKELLATELLLLEAFSWDLCLPTPAHFLDYYLLASISQKDHHCHTWPTTCLRKTKECLKEYAHYFLEVTLQGEGTEAVGGGAQGLGWSGSRGVSSREGLLSCPESPHPHHSPFAKKCKDMPRVAE